MHDFETMKLCSEEYLRYIRSAMREIESINDDIAEQQATIELAGISYGEGRSAVSADRIPDAIAKAMELCDKRSEAYARFADDIDEAKALCSSKYPSRHAMWLRFVEGKSWREISSAMGYSTRHVQRMADNGVAAIYYAMPERWRRDPIPNAAPL